MLTNPVLLVNFKAFSSCKITECIEDIWMLVCIGSHIFSYR